MVCERVTLLVVATRQRVLASRPAANDRHKTCSVYLLQKSAVLMQCGYLYSLRNKGRVNHGHKKIHAFDESGYP